jgi:hypothetical protein
VAELRRAGINVSIGRLHCDDWRLSILCNARRYILALPKSTNRSKVWL